MGAPADGAGEADGERGAADEPLVPCRFQGGTLSVYADHVALERSSASLFEDKRIPMAEVRGVDLSPGILTGHVQIRQAGVEPGAAGFLSHPVDENTLYFPRLRRGCAERARDAILERAGVGT